VLRENQDKYAEGNVSNEVIDRMFMDSEQIIRTDEESKLLIQEFESLPIKVDFIDWRFESFGNRLLKVKFIFITVLGSQSLAPKRRKTGLKNLFF
jgi:hypothetical protein